MTPSSAVASLTEAAEGGGQLLGQALVQLSGVGTGCWPGSCAMAEAGAVQVDEAGSTRGFYRAAVCLA